MSNHGGKPMLVQLSTDKTVLATLKPTTLLAMFNTPQLKKVAKEVKDTIVKIMKAAEG
jgi:uncharacterized protein (DUF302 family)